MRGRFIHEALEAIRLPEFAGAGIGGVDRQLRRQQHGIDAGLGNLLRHHLPVAHVTLQRRAVAVEEHHDHAGLPGVEVLGHMHQHAAVVIGLVLPVHLAGIAAVPAALALGDVEERRFRAWIVAEIGERRGLHADQRGQVFLVGGALERKRRGVGGDAIRRRRGSGRDLLGAHCALARRLARRPFEAFALARKTIPELRRGEAVFEGVAAGRMRVGGQRFRRRRLAALNQQGRERHKDSEEGQHAPTRRHAEWHRRAIMRR